MLTNIGVLAVGVGKVQAIPYFKTALEANCFAILAKLYRRTY